MKKALLDLKNIWSHNWKWALPVMLFVSLITLFFSITGNATYRYGSVYLQPSIIKNAQKKAEENDLVIEKLGNLQPHNFFHLLEGEVAYLNQNKSVMITVGIIGSKGRAKLDIVANRNGKDWKYQKITVRIKKPKKEIIKIFEE